MTYTAERGAFALTAQTMALGRDLFVAVTGGAAHIGSLSMATPRPSLADPAVTSATASTFCYPGHKDDKVGARFAEVLSGKLSRKVAVLCGIHFDGLTPQGIRDVTALAEELLDQVLRGEQQ